jgi:hypothetical protein
MSNAPCTFAQRKHHPEHTEVDSTLVDTATTPCLLLVVKSKTWLRVFPEMKPSYKVEARHILLREHSETSVALARGSKKHPSRSCCLSAVSKLRMSQLSLMIPRLLVAFTGSAWMIDAAVYCAIKCRTMVNSNPAGRKIYVTIHFKRSNWD